MEGFNGFFLDYKGKRLKLVTDIEYKKVVYYLFDDGNFYYFENGKPVCLDKENEKHKNLISKILEELKQPLMDVIDEGERAPQNTIKVEPFKRNN